LVFMQQNCNDIITHMLNECYMIVTNYSKKGAGLQASPGVKTKLLRAIPLNGLFLISNQLLRIELANVCTRFINFELMLMGIECNGSKMVYPELSLSNHINFFLACFVIILMM